jgi:predicted nucleic acid-binding protein
VSVGSIKYLLDTNFIIRVLKKEESVLKIFETYDIKFKTCAYSPITKIELLSFPRIVLEEQRKIYHLLTVMTRLNLTPAIEDFTIELRKNYHKIKLPDAVILGTALCHELQFLTFDEDLQKIFKSKKH